ncbi:MAG TPA: hypothetical protein VH561_08685 [Micromonosporaceae bacterium]
MRTAGVLAGAVMLLVALPGTAGAVVSLSANTAVVTSTPDTYTFSTRLQYWSVVAVQPSAGADFDLQVSDGAGAPLVGSYWGSGVTDFVAVNSTGGARPLGGYRAQVTHFSGTGVYDVMFWEKRVVFGVPTDPVGGVATALGLQYGWPAAAYMIYLRQGQGFRVNESDYTQVFLAGSTPGVPSTYVRSRSQLANAYVIADNVPAANGAHCRVFQATSAGWYSLIIVFTGGYEPPPYNGGLAVFPQRYDPSQGDTLTNCPVPQVP